MTRAPANLLAVRRLLLDHLNIDPGKVRDDDLEPGEVGIVGDAAHRGGYHCGSDRVVSNDYSVVESSRDRAGLSDYASGLDVGLFEVRSGGKVHTLRSFSVWCVAQCEAGAADTRDIREIIYSPDGRTVKRWDRLGKRSSGDSSHLIHTHFSFFRDSTKAGRDLTPLFRRYLTAIGLIKAPTVQEDDMPLTLQDRVAIWTHDLQNGPGEDPAYKVLLRAAAEAQKARLTGEAVLAAVQGLDTKAIIARINQVAAAEVERDQAAARRDAELAELARQAKSGDLDAAEFVREFVQIVGEKLASPAS